MRIETIEIDTLKSNSLNICALQLFTPFIRDIVVHAEDNKNYFGWKPDRSKRREIKLSNILDNVGKSLGSVLDIIVLPEYHIDFSHKDIILNFAKVYNIIAIFNYYDAAKRKSITNIVFPDGKEFSQFKLDPSPHDEDFLSNTTENEKIIYHFRWKYGGKTSYFQALTCFDFITFFHEAIDRHTPGTIIVPMCSPVIKDFEGIASHLIRSGKYCNTNKAVVLCNSTTPSSFKPSKEIPKPFPGFTQVVAPSKYLNTIVPINTEGGIYVEINPHLSCSKLSPLYRKNSVLNNLVLFTFDQKGTIETIENEENMALAVNPNIMNKFGQKKIYLFYKVKKYHNIRELLKKLPVSCSGIFGLNDVLIQSHEEDISFLEARLRGSLGAKHGVLESPIPYFVDEVYKFRGVNLFSLDSEGQYIPIKVNARIDYLEKRRQDIRKILLGEEPSPRLRNEFLKRNILLSCTGTSDISILERNEGKEEYLVFIIFDSKEFFRATELVDRFKSRILASILTDDRIRTVEFSGNSSDSPNGGCCILHVVGGLRDLRNIVLGDLHKKMHHYDIEYGTRVVPIAENLSNDQYKTLKETTINEYEQKETIKSIIEYCRSFGDPFIIKQLPLDILSPLLSIYVEYKEWVDKISTNDLEDKKILLLKIDEFVYGIAYAVSSDKDNFSIETYKHYTQRFIDSMYRFTEHILIDLLAEKAEEVGKTKLEEAINQSKDRKGKSLNYSLEQTTLGKVTQAITIWNKKHSKKYGLIGEKDFASVLGKIQGFVEFRNSISHFSKDKYDSKLIKKVLKQIQNTFNFVRTYYRG